MCYNSEGDERNSLGLNCFAYYENPDYYCGLYDTVSDDNPTGFSSLDMCCTCQDLDCLNTLDKTNSRGETCEVYVDDPEKCCQFEYDTDEFTATEMCCVCKDQDCSNFETECSD